MDQVVKRLGFTVETLGRGPYTVLRHIFNDRFNGSRIERSPGPGPGSLDAVFFQEPPASSFVITGQSSQFFAEPDRMLLFLRDAHRLRRPQVFSGFLRRHFIDCAHIAPQSSLYTQPGEKEDRDRKIFLVSREPSEANSFYYPRSGLKHASTSTAA